MKRLSNISTLLALVALTATAQVQAQNIVAKDPWVRATVTQQKATGMFAQIISSADARLVEARSPAAGVVEIHEMSMDGNMMKMRALPDGLELPAGKAVDLKPGGYHVMLMDLKQPLKAGDTVEVTLVVEGKDKKRENIVLKAPVRALNAMPAAAAPADHQHKH